MTIVKQIVLATILLSGFCIEAMAGAHVRKPCEAFMSVYGLHYQTARLWNRNGDRVAANNHYEKNEIGIYGEYGLTCCDTIVGKVRIIDEDDSRFGGKSGVEEAELGWKRQLWKCDDHVISAQALVVIPGGEYDNAVHHA